MQFLYIINLLIILCLNLNLFYKYNYILLILSEGDILLKFMIQKFYFLDRRVFTLSYYY